MQCVLCSIGTPGSAFSVQPSSSFIIINSLLTGLIIQALRPGSNLELISRCIFEGLGETFLGIQSQLGGRVQLQGPLAIFDQTFATNGAISVKTGGVLNITQNPHQIVGDNIAGFGILVEGGCIATYIGTNKPVITGSEGAVKLGQTVLADYDTIPTLDTTEGAGLVRSS